ncbi:MAG: family 43 glycosylhydrolase [Bacteroidaceae bacterium]|nr:family 43 glycosylhydrolase [Bacteroidaceae bacterium]
MRKLLFCFLSVCALCPAIVAQSFRSVSIWRNGTPTDYSLLTLDSMTINAADSTMIVYNAIANKESLVGIDSVTVSVPPIQSTNKSSVKELKEVFKDVTVSSSSYKAVGNNNPLMGHKFGADPFGMVDGDRLYVYMTDDHIYNSSTGKPIPDSDYSDCKNVSIISSDDLVNWTDHGAQPVAGQNGGKGPAKWANNMWAPCAAHKTINGKEKYFLYFADNASGIGVLTADSPYGPWKQPSGMNQLISRNTANCGTVTWLFDPAVLVDDDGKAYLYFGGGVPNGKDADPGTARCVQLGDNMTSIVGTPQTINPPYLFEDAGINKVGGKYLYSYCSNWTGNNGPGVANIAYMESDNPLGPFSYVGRCFDNPGGASWSGGGGNNHHAIIEFQGKYYILYHNRSLKKAMRSDNKDITDGMEVRSACLSEIYVDTVNARITNLSSSEIKQTGVAQLKNFDPYRTVPGPTMAWIKNITTKYFILGNVYVCTAEMKKGSWLCLSKVDFKEGAIGFTAKVKGSGVLAITTGSPGKKGTYLVLAEVDSPNTYQEITVPTLKVIKNVQNKLYFTSSGNISLESWSFIKQE